MQNLIDKIRYAFVWLSRIGNCRGFGVQSPSAYSFIRYVINEHYPYYSYSDLRVLFPNLLWKQRKLFELYFRLSNFAQSKYWLINGSISNSLDTSLANSLDTSLANSLDCSIEKYFEAYIKAGCNMTDTLTKDTIAKDSIAKDTLTKDTLTKISSANDIHVVFTRDILAEELINWFCMEAPTDSFLIYEGIYSSSLKQKQWQRLIADSRTGCSYDLYYCGILFKDTNKIKQHYRVNF